MTKDRLGPTFWHPRNVPVHTLTLTANVCFKTTPALTNQMIFIVTYLYSRLCVTSSIFTTVCHFLNSNSKIMRAKTLCNILFTYGLLHKDAELSQECTFNRLSAALLLSKTTYFCSSISTTTYQFLLLKSQEQSTLTVKIWRNTFLTMISHTDRLQNTSAQGS
jgi:hypothetical protein